MSSAYQGYGYFNSNYGTSNSSTSSTSSTSSSSTSSSTISTYDSSNSNQAWNYMSVSGNAMTQQIGYFNN